jgi:hypothetical protein
MSADESQPPMREILSDERYQQLLREAFGNEWAAICNLAEDRMRALARVDELHGKSLRDKTWPTEGGNEPEPEPGWDPSGTYRPDVVRQIYEELIAAGVIKNR